ncbi:MAG: hypothetical protein JWN17_2696 [Frankiales bacterium]|nr:hypothetical protein [Frankiales bacterium]
MRRRTGSSDGRLGLFERLLFSFMGPPQIGEDRPREGYVPDPQADLCHRCGRPWTEHGRVHTSSMTYRPCPD